jgi:hypothetical protein
MSNLAYLGIAVVISLVGCVILWLRTRRPQSMEHSMREFSRELDALAPTDGSPEWRLRQRGRGAG